MRNIARKLALVTATAVCVSGAVGHGQAPAPAELTERDAIGVVRRINTAQAAAHRGSKDGSYCSFASLLDTDPGLRSQATEVTARGATLPGYELTLTLTSDGKGYQVSATPTRKCAAALFSTEAGVIYRGWGLGCPAQP